MRENKQALLFANTLWFLINFKSSLIEELHSKNYKIKILYLRKGGVIDQKILQRIVSKKIKILPFYKYFFSSILPYKSSFSNLKSEKLLFSFTIGPLFLGLLPVFFKYKKFATLEGLGRLFTSRSLHHRVLKRFVEIFYRYYLFKRYEKVFVLNYVDYAYILEHKLVSISKIFIIPGTGIDADKFNPKILKKERKKLNLYDSSNNLKTNKLYITFIGRISPEKGFYRFIAAVFFLISTEESKKFKFRIVSPKSDISNLPTSFKDHLNSLDIELKNYSANPLEYYAYSKIIVIPTTYAEGLSRVALEASFLGIPIAAISNRGVTALFFDGILGELTMDQEPYGISLLIKKINENYSDYIVLPEKVFESLRRKYDNNASITSLLRVIEKN